MNVLKNQQEASELRITAYLSAILCPSPQLDNKIQSILDSEPVSIVSTFIKKHLNSSRFKRQSFLPQTVYLNLTTQLFGKKSPSTSIEIETRQEDAYLSLITRRKRRQVENSDFDFDFDIDISIKFFGNELNFLSKNEGSFLSKSINSLFLDADLSFPTGIGFQLQLQTQGTVFVSFSNYDVRTFPSTTIEIKSNLMVDLKKVKTGLQLYGNVHSSNGTVSNLVY